MTDEGRTDEPDTERGHQKYLLWVLAVLLAASIANFLAWSTLPSGARVVRPRDDASLSEVVRTSQLAVQRRAGLYVDLYDLARGRYLIIYSDSGVDPTFASILAELTVEVREDESPFLFLGPLGEPDGELRTVSREVVPYWLVLAAGDRVLHAGSTRGGVVVVSESLVELSEDPPE